MDEKKRWRKSLAEGVSRQQSSRWHRNSVKFCEFLRNFPIPSHPEASTPRHCFAFGSKPPSQHVDGLMLSLVGNWLSIKKIVEQEVLQILMPTGFPSFNTQHTSRYKVSPRKLHQNAELNRHRRYIVMCRSMQNFPSSFVKSITKVQRPKISWHKRKKN